MNPPLEAPLVALLKSQGRTPANEQTDAEMLEGIRARRAKRTGMARVIRKKKEEQ